MPLDVAEDEEAPAANLELGRIASKLHRVGRAIGTKPAVLRFIPRGRRDKGGAMLGRGEVVGAAVMGGGDGVLAAHGLAVGEVAHRVEAQQHQVLAARGLDGGAGRAASLEKESGEDDGDESSHFVNDTVAVMIARAALVLAAALPAIAAEPATESARVDSLFAAYDKPDSPGCAVGVIPMAASFREGLRHGKPRAARADLAIDGHGSWLASQAIHGGGRGAPLQRRASSRSTTTCAASCRSFPSIRRRFACAISCATRAACATIRRSSRCRAWILPAPSPKRRRSRCFHASAASTSRPEPSTSTTTPAISCWHSW